MVPPVVAAETKYVHVPWILHGIHLYLKESLKYRLDHFSFLQPSLDRLFSYQRKTAAYCFHFPGIIEVPPGHFLVLGDLYLKQRIDEGG